MVILFAAICFFATFVCALYINKSVEYSEGHVIIPPEKSYPVSNTYIPPKKHKYTDEWLAAAFAIEGDFIIHEKLGLETLNGRLIIGNLSVKNNKVLKILQNIEITGDCVLDSCKKLTEISPSVKIGGDLSLKGCTSLERLPDNLSVGGKYLNVPKHLVAQIPFVDLPLYIARCDTDTFDLIYERLEKGE